MRIEGQKRTASVRKSGTAKGGSASTGFSVSGGAEETPSNAPMSSLQAGQDVSGLDALLALQAVDDPLLAKKKAVKRGRSLLDTLEALKLDLLAGEVGEGRLQRLMALLAEARQTVDPNLQQVVEDIELRARVELAKLGHYTG